jgi:hypothetical protein
MRRRAPVLGREALSAEIAELSKANVRISASAGEACTEKLRPSISDDPSWCARSLTISRRTLSEVSNPRLVDFRLGSSKRLALEAPRRNPRIERRKRELS